MESDTQTKTYRINLTWTFSAPREKVFQAWTDPKLLEKWWAMADDWTTPIAEVDLKVGGKYRLGMKPPDKDEPHIVVGSYREVSPPEKLVYTWAWEGEDQEETLVTVEFKDLGDSTEVILTHENFAEEARKDQHDQGWVGCLNLLEKMF